MFTVVALILSHLAVGGAGVYFSPKIEAWLASWTAAKALADAKKVIADAEAAAAKLEAAKKVVAAAPKPVVTATVTGPTGATGV